MPPSDAFERSIRLLALSACAIVPPLLIAARLAGSPGIHLFGDAAQEELQVIAALHREQLLGAWSHYRFFQPGPAFFYWLAPFYWATGGEAWGLSLGVCILNWAALLALAFLLCRWLGNWCGAALPAPLLLGLLGASPATTLTNFWAPSAIVVPCLLLVPLHAGLASGHGEALVWIVLLDSLILQTYAAPAAVILALSAATLAIILVRRRQDRSRAAPTRRQLLLASTVLLVLWMPSLYEQLAPGGGNLSALAAFLRSPAPPQAATTTLSLLGTELMMPWSAIPNSPAAPTHPAWGATVAGVQFALLLVAAWIASRRGWRYAAALAGLGALCLPVALWSIHQLRDPVPKLYMLRWIAALAAVNWMAVVGVLGSWLLSARRKLAQREGSPARVWPWLFAAWLLLAVAVRPLSPIGGSRYRPEIETLGNALLAYLDHHHARGKLVAIHARAAYRTSPWAAALASFLYHSDRRACGMPSLPAWGRPWQCSAGEEHVNVEVSDAALDRPSGLDLVRCERIVPPFLTEIICLYASPGS